jgi:hypothetical protein
LNENLISPVAGYGAKALGGVRDWTKNQILYNNDNAPLYLPPEAKTKEMHERGLKDDQARLAAQGRIEFREKAKAAQEVHANWANMDEDERRQAILEEGREKMRQMMEQELVRRQVRMGNNQLGMGMGMANKGAQPSEVLQPFPQGKAIETKEEKDKREKEESERKKFEDKQKADFFKFQKDQAMEQIAFKKEDLAAQKQSLQESKWGLSDEQYDLRKAKHAQATMSDTASLGSATMLESLNSANKGAEEQLADANRNLELQQRELERQTEALNRIAFNTKHESSVID